MSSPQLANNPRAGVRLSLPDDTGPVARTSKDRGVPKLLDFDLSDDDDAMNVSSTSPQVSAPKRLDFGGVLEDSDPEDENVVTSSTPCKPRPTTSSCSTPTHQQLPTAASSASALTAPAKPTKKTSPASPSDLTSTPQHKPPKKVVVFSTPLKRPPKARVDRSSGSNKATPRVTPDTQKIACDKQRSEPPKVRRKSDLGCSSSPSTDSPAKTRSGRIYKKRSLSPMSTPKSADTKRRPNPNNLKLKLNLLQSDIVQPKCAKRAKTASDSNKESSDNAEQSAAKQRLEPPPELPSPKLTEPPKLMAKANKRPVSRLRQSTSPAARRWEQYKSGDQGSTPVRGITRLSPPSTAGLETSIHAIETSIHEAPTRSNPSPPTQGLSKMRLDDLSPPFTGFPGTSPKTIPRPSMPPRVLLDFEGEDGGSRRASMPSKLPSGKGDMLAGRRRKHAANVNPFTPTPNWESLKKRKLAAQSPNETTPEGRLAADEAAIAANGMATPSNGVGRVPCLDEPAESPNAAPGKRIRVSDINISRYHEEFIELDELASGEFGRVCVCRHRLDGMVYAIKMSKNEIKGQTHAERVVMNEVFAHSALIKHKHVVRYYNSWVENGRVYIQNEFCEGGSLAAKIEELRLAGKRFSEHDLKKIILQVLKGLLYIHSKSLVHLDIKPENIFIAVEHGSANSSPTGIASDPEVAAAILAENVAAELAAVEAAKAGAAAAAAAIAATVKTPSSAATGSSRPSSDSASAPKKQDQQEGDNQDPENKDKEKPKGPLDSTDSGNVSSDYRLPPYMIHHMDISASYKVGDLGHVVSVETGQSHEEGDCRYMAPELLMDGVPKPHLFKSDVFSLGLSLYEAATLVPLPRNSSDNPHYSVYKSGKLPNIDGYSKDINAVIRMMCNPDPMGRPSVARLISIMSRPLTPNNIKVTKTRTQLTQEVLEVKARLQALEEELRQADLEGQMEGVVEGPVPQDPMDAMDVEALNQTPPPVAATPPPTSSDDGVTRAGTCSMTLRKRVPKVTPKAKVTPKVTRRSTSLRKKALMKGAASAL